LLEVNWLTPTKIREVYVTGEQGMFVANYITQDLFFYEIEKAKGVQWGALSVMRGVNEGAMIRYAINRKEPMRAEVEAFLQAVTGESKVYANGADGLAALELALALIRSGLEHTVVAVNQMKVTTAYKAEAMGM
jgi:predicted dehydrogenase